MAYKSASINRCLPHKSAMHMSVRCVSLEGTTACHMMISPADLGKGHAARPLCEHPNSHAVNALFQIDKLMHDGHPGGARDKSVPYLTLSADPRDKSIC